MQEGVLQVDARAIRQSGPGSTDQASPPRMLAVHRPLVVERVIEVAPRLYALLIVGSDLDCGSVVAIGDLAFGEQPIVDAVGAADTAASILLPAPRLPQRRLKRTPEEG